MHGSGRASSGLRCHPSGASLSGRTVPAMVSAHCPYLDLQDPDGLSFPAALRLGFCDHDLRRWWDWTPAMTFKRLVPSLLPLQNRNGAAAQTLKAV